ncbi:MAG: CpaF family protein [Cyanobacteria bacterium NC_groundwater_1444_Ag_S-0.65um_54_12]|nr:CpaF family protein [Cyanobacteria bacterium NC_groundwater_1444_Ag_S-0.65um_54_12]
MFLKNRLAQQLTASQGRSPYQQRQATADLLPPVLRQNSLSTATVARSAVTNHSDLKADLKSAAHLRLVEDLRRRGLDDTADPNELRETIRQVLESLANTGRPLARTDKDRLIEEIYHDVLGLGPLEPLLADDEISEIMVNGPSKVYVERAGRIEKVEVCFTHEAHLRRIIDRIVSRVGRRIDDASPLCDARLADGSRVNAIIPPLALDGSVLTIRKFRREPLRSADLLSLNTLSGAMVKFLELAVIGKLNILISGGTGSGKTTLLNVLSAFIPEGERLITIEDAAELQLQQEHVIRLETRNGNIEGAGRIDQAELLRNSLRMRPDRIILGEVRGGEALTMLQAMNTGHEGSLATIHANSPRDATARLETMVLLAGMDLPLRAIREQLASALDLIVQIERSTDGKRRMTSITEVVGLEGETLMLQEIYTFHRLGLAADGSLLGKFRSCGLRPKCAERLAIAGLEFSAELS